MNKREEEIELFEMLIDGYEQIMPHEVRVIEAMRKLLMKLRGYD